MLSPDAKRPLARVPLKVEDAGWIQTFKRCKENERADAHGWARRKEAVPALSLSLLSSFLISSASGEVAKA